MKKKLKRKTWIFSTSIFLAYITILILNPTIWTVILPIIIPTGTLTIGIPIYNIKNSLKQKNKEQKIFTKKLKIGTNQNMKTKEILTTNDIEREKIDHIELETQYEQNINQEEKPKVKTKGTIH